MGPSLVTDYDHADTDVAELCAKARELLGTSGPFRVRVLLDMTLIELASEAAERVSSLRSDSPVES